jgi:hypothetical protein
MLLISGGDRHGVEPNANINLTNATSFNEFVHEVRKERRSNVLFMPQYAEPWKHRILQSTMDAIRDYPEFPAGLPNLGREGLSSGRQWQHPPPERDLAWRPRPQNPQFPSVPGAYDGEGAVLKQPALRLGATRINYALNWATRKRTEFS